MTEPARPAPNPYTRGFRLAVDGIKLAFRSEDVGRAYLKVAAVIFSVSLVIGGLGLWALWTHAVPGEDDPAMWMVIASWIVRVVGSALTLIVAPLLAILVVNVVFPLFNQGVFIAGLRVADPDRAARLEAKPGMPLMPAAGIASWRLLKFVAGSLVFFAIGLVPVVGTIAGTVGQLWLSARTVAWELLDPYFDCLDIRYAEQRELVERHNKTLLGFGLPIALIFAVPFVGPLLFGLAQVAGAHFVAHELPVDPREHAEPDAPPR